MREVPQIASPRPDMRQLPLSSSCGGIAWNQVARVMLQPGLDINDGRISPLRQAPGAGSRTASPLRPTSVAPTWPTPVQGQVVRTVLQQAPALPALQAVPSRSSSPVPGGQPVMAQQVGPARVISDNLSEKLQQLQQAKSIVAQQHAAQQLELRSRKDRIRREMLQVMGQFGEALNHWASSPRQEESQTAQSLKRLQLSSTSPAVQQLHSASPVVQARLLPQSGMVPGANAFLLAPSETGYPRVASGGLAADQSVASEPFGQDLAVDYQAEAASRVALPCETLPAHVGNGVAPETGGVLPSSPHLSDSTMDFRNIERAVAAEQGYPLAVDPSLPSLEAAAELAATAACATALGQLSEQRNLGTWSPAVHVLPDERSDVVDDVAPRSEVRELSPPARAQERTAPRTRQLAHRTPSPQRTRGSGSGTSRGSRANASRPLSPQAQEEMSRCNSTIAWCCEQLTTSSLRELRNFRHPPSCVRTIFEAMGILLGNADPKNFNARKLLTGSIQERLRGIKLESISLAQFRRVRRLLVLPDFDEELVRAACASAVPLAIWCRAIGSCLSKTRFSSWGGPEIHSVAPLIDEEADQAAPPSDSELRYRSESANVEANEALDGRTSGSMAIGNLVVAPDLSRLGSRELRQVRELTVSRPEVGSITFHGVTDCSSLDLARLVHLDVGEVLVYPEPGSKAPIGQGLNKPATVTMYQCWPPNGRGHLEDAKAQERYRFKIQQMTEEKRAKFIDYNCATGVWKFQVDHF